MVRSGESGELPDLSAAEWLTRPQTQRVFAALTAAGAEARAVGGAVRNALMRTPVKDIDIATTAPPEEVMRLAKAAGLHAIPTGVEHGTVTLVADHVPFEVTTLRKDIETFGRRARVTFTTDWREDARRRDFTMNALYCSADGRVHDPLNGYADLTARRVRFIGDARERIREDFLRILRFFRFLAQYGDARHPDPAGLAASIAEKAGLAALSGERIHAELVRLLASPGARDAVLSMHDAGILVAALGMPADVDRFLRILAIEDALGRAPDPILRLGALLNAAEPDAVQRKLRLSGAEVERLRNMRMADAALQPDTDQRPAKALLYRKGPGAFVDAGLMAWARSNDAAASPERARHLAVAARWHMPELPVRGADVIALGVAPGPEVGRVLDAFERWWIAEDFPSDRERAAEKVVELVRGAQSGKPA
jgi:poly(A) polymerase